MFHSASKSPAGPWTTGEPTGGPGWGCGHLNSCDSRIPLVHCCDLGVDVPKDVCQQRGLLTNLMPRRELEPLGSKWASLGTLCTAGHLFLHYHPFFHSPLVPIYGLKMNSDVHAIIAAVRILSHTMFLY